MEEIVKTPPELGKTTNTYGLPIPQDTKVQGLLYETKSHSGPDRGAIDIAVDLDTPVICPFNGVVVLVVDTNDRNGPTSDFAKYNNFIEIEHADGEYSRLSHIAKGSSLVRPGDHVVEGQQVATVGLVGATTRPHLHWMIAKKTEATPGYTSLRIQHKKPIENLL